MEWLDKFIAKRLKDENAKKIQPGTSTIPTWKIELENLIDEQKNQFRNKHHPFKEVEHKVIAMTEQEELKQKHVVPQNYSEGHIGLKGIEEVDKNVRALDKLRSMPGSSSNKSGRVSAIFELLGEQEAFEAMRRLRWPTGVNCPRCASTNVKRRNIHSHNDKNKSFHYFYECENCKNKGEPSIFDDLIGMPKDLSYYEIRKIMMCWYMLSCCSISQISRELGIPLHQITQILSYLHNESAYAEQRNVKKDDLEEVLENNKKLSSNIDTNAQAKEGSNELDMHSRLRERNREIIRQSERFITKQKI